MDTYDYVKSCMDGYSDDEAKRRINAFVHRDVDCTRPTIDVERLAILLSEQYRLFGNWDDMHEDRKDEHRRAATAIAKELERKTDEPK